MEKEMKIIPPEGYEVDKENSTFECIKFKQKLQPPKTWEEFCETHPLKEGEAWITSLSEVTSIDKEKGGGPRCTDRDKQVVPSKQYAEAIRALCQLIQLRDCYNQGWKPNWTNGNEFKYTVYSTYGKIAVGIQSVTSHILSFKNAELRDTFRENFKDLIEIAKPLL